MPKLGDIVTALELLSKKNRYEKYIWHSCSDCGKERWVQISHQQPLREKCHPCGCKGTGARERGENNPNWKGGRFLGGMGYWFVAVPDDSPFVAMRNKERYVLEHRLIVAQSLGRCLKSWEVVHHINRNKQDNRLENLELVSVAQHDRITLLEQRVDTLEKLLKELKDLTNPKQQQVKEDDK